MKKLLTIVFAIALMSAMAVQAQATALETSGEIRARGWYVDNYLVDGQSTDWWDQRLRLVLNWPVAENVKVTARADIKEGNWGYEAVGGGLATEETIAFDWAFMQFTWPATPVTFTIGRQDASWGTGMAAMSDNEDRFKVTAKFDPVTVGFVYAAANEVGTNQNSDTEVDDKGKWILLAMGAFGDWKAGALASYTLDETRGEDATRSSLLLDAYGMGKAGPVEVKAEIAAVSGKNKDTDIKQSGLGAYVGGFMTAGPVKVGLEAAYAAGDKTDSEKNEGAFKFDYNSAFWSVILYNNLDYSGYMGSPVSSSYGASTDSGVANALAAKLSAVMTPMPQLTLVGNLLWARADKVPDGVKKDLGIEADIVAIYAVTENVSVTGGLGYMVLGKAWDGTGENGEDPSNPLGVMMAFTTKF